MNRRLLVRLTAIAIVYFAPSFGRGQGPTASKQLTAKVTKVQGSKVFVIAPQGEYLVQVNDKNSLAVMGGTVGGEALRAGLSVRFEAVLDEKHVVKDEVQSVTVFTPTKSYGYRIDLPKTESGKRNIVGKISKVSEKGEVTLSIPGEEKVQFTLAKDATVALELKLREPLALKLLQPGDTVLLAGLGSDPKGKVPGRVLVDSIFLRREAQTPAEGESDLAQP